MSSIEEIKDNEAKYIEYDMECNAVYRKAQSIVTNSFVDSFNDIFYCEVDRNGIPLDGFTPKEGTKRGNIKKDWLKIHLYNLLYDLYHEGCNIGIDRINGRWVNIVDEGRHFVRTDKFFGLFLFDYKMEQMFPNAAERFRTYRRFTRLRIKLNSPKSEWIKII